MGVNKSNVQVLLHNASRISMCLAVSEQQLLIAKRLPFRLIY